MIMMCTLSGVVKLHLGASISITCDALSATPEGRVKRMHGRHFLNKVGESASMDPKPGLEGPFRGSPPAFPALRNGGKI